MIGKLKTGKLVEIKSIIPDWNRVETVDGVTYSFREFEIMYNSKSEIMSKTKDAVIDNLNSRQALISKYDKVIIPAQINGYGIDIEAEVYKVGTTLGRTYVAVDYINPTSTPDGNRSGCYYIEQLKLKANNHE